MKLHFLDKAINPRSIAVIGASNNLNSVGGLVFKNLIEEGYSGKIIAINPKYQEVQGYRCLASIKNIKDTVDLAVIATPARTISEILMQCGQQHVAIALILSAGFSEMNTEGANLEKKILTIARRYNIRLIGPNCLGLISPQAKVNVTFSNNKALNGNLALVSQSGALCVAILDWAAQKQIGFSAMVSVGNTADVDFGDMLDYFALDENTQSILLYIEGIHSARRFMSGLRRAARMKPVIVIKAGRHSQGSRAAISHTGALVGADDVFDAALKRAGAVRVTTIEQLFSAAQILASNYRTAGNRLGIITNGGGAGVMAADQAQDFHVAIPELSVSTYKKLSKLLPPQWSHHNPIDILGDATPERYQQVISTCLDDENIDGLLTILLPLAMTQPDKVAEEVIKIAQQNKKPLLACWMGQKQMKVPWKAFAKHKLPYFSTPEAAVEAFSYLADYQHNQELLMQVPEPIAFENKSDSTGARLIIESVLAERRDILTTIESKAVLTAFGIPVTQTIETHTPNEALVAAQSLGFPVVMKINSPDISHKQEVGGVQLNITNGEAVRQIFEKMIARAQQERPKAKINGVTVERMYKNPNDRELMIGVLRDPVFGPVISFGAGGSIVEVMQDRTIALPPLNQFIAEQMIVRTRVGKLLGAFRNMPAVNINAIKRVLLRISEMVCELPEIKEMDINPLIANDYEIIAVDARIVVKQPPPTITPYGHMAIHPYPAYLVSQWQLADGTTITIRPIRPEDANMEQEFVRNLSAKSKYFRFMQNIQELTPAMLARFTQIDYDREMALVAVYTQDGKEVYAGVARYMINPDLETCEFALVIGDAWQNKGLGSHLMSYLIDTAKNKGLKFMLGEILADNIEMLMLVRNLGFTINDGPDRTVKIAVKPLSQ